MRPLTEEEEALGVESEKSTKKTPTAHCNLYAESYQSSLEKFKKDIYRKPVVNLFRNTFWYTFGFTDLGKPFCDGPFMTKQEAETASSQLDTYELFELGTKNRQRATSEIKHQLIDRGGNPDVVLKNMLHQIPKEKPKRRKRQWF